MINRIPKRFDLKGTLIALSLHDTGGEEFHHPSHWDFVAVVKVLGAIAFAAVAIGVIRLGVLEYLHTINNV